MTKPKNVNLLTRRRCHFKPRHLVDKAIRQGRRILGAGLGMNVSERPLGQHLLAADDDEFRNHRLCSNARAANPDLKLVVEDGRAAIVSLGAHRIEFQRVVADKGEAQLAHILRHRHIEIEEVVDVENNALRVALGPAHTQRVEEGKVTHFSI